MSYSIFFPFKLIIKYHTYRIIKAAQEKVKNQIAQKSGGEEKSGQSEGASGIVKAVCMLNPDGDSGVSGKVVLEAQEKGTKITGTVTGLKPGKHGFNIHELGMILSLFCMEI